MPRSFEGDHDAAGLRFGVIASRFNDEFVDGLLRGALDCLARHGAKDDDVSVYRVPGAFEIPTTAREIRRGLDAIVALGCLLRGETLHFELIAAQVTNDLSRLAIEERIPLAFGVITCNTAEQAAARSSPGAGNKGWEAALAAIEMANLWRALRSEEE